VIAFGFIEEFLRILPAESLDPRWGGLSIPGRFRTPFGQGEKSTDERAFHSSFGSRRTPVFPFLTFKESGP
jgi:hypothetical protein